MRKASRSSRCTVRCVVVGMEESTSLLHREAYRHGEHLRVSLQATEDNLQYIPPEYDEITYVVGSIGMIISTAEERSGHVFADALYKKMASTRMLIHEIFKVVNESGDDNQLAAFALLDKVLPADNR